ncbi:hypothetical protein GCM10010302_31940 [Streptomyces polychromogenes]|uniref:Uncharacterized protein n=1 Tax=Streptomyces polychromogenes TaxID=67342 RepID=A0ABN0VDP4_9ACTN
MTCLVRVDRNALFLGEEAQIRFTRILRLPESGTYALPPGLREFPLRRVEDSPDTVPPEWLAKGGVRRRPGFGSEIYERHNELGSVPPIMDCGRMPP